MVAIVNEKILICYRFMEVYKSGNVADSQIVTYKTIILLTMISFL